MKIESPDDQDFIEYFLALAAGHDFPKLIATIDSEGKSLDHFQVCWSAGIAEEQGFYPLISSPSPYISYFIFYAKSTGTTGYMSFSPTTI